MKLEATRIICDWLIDSNNAGHGVNSYLATVPRDAGDPAPDPIAGYSDAGFPNTTIAVFDDTRHPWVGEAKEPPAWPALYVKTQGVLRVQGEPYPDGAIRATVSPLQIAIRYISQDTDMARAIRNGNYTMRAVLRSLRELDKESTVGDNARLRNGIYLVLAQGPTEIYPVMGSVGQARIYSAMLVNYLVRDGLPSY